MSRIKICQTKLSEAAKKNVKAVLDSGWLETGPHTAKFEEKFKKVFEAPNALLLTSCTAALHLSLEMIKKPGFDIITTPMTFVATNLAIRMAQMQPKFVDIDPKTGNIDPDAVADAIDEYTAGIMAVHYGGLPCEMMKLMGIADGAELPLIQDAAHAMGARYDGMWIGSFGDYVCFSMNAKKNCGVGDGGVLVCRDPKKDKIARRMRWFGLDKTTYQAKRGVGDKWWMFECPDMGYKYNPTDIMAAIARAELDHLNYYNKYRRQLIETYREQLHDVDGITLLKRYYPWVTLHSGYLMVVKAKDRNKLVEKLTAHDIECNVHYLPSNCFEVFGGSEKVCQEETPNAYEFYKQALTLPLHCGLSEEEVKYICSVIRGGW